ncbi:MAG: leucine-rich repeat protein [Clostridia bacterium]|nr:leucine-rich repeat protein [Clostridia bacterium]
METDKTNIDYYGRQKSIGIHFTFRYQRVNYALANFGNDDFRVLRIKWSPSSGLFVEKNNEHDTLEIAETIYHTINESNHYIQHFKVEKHFGEYTAKKSNGLLFLNPVFTKSAKLVLLCIAYVLTILELIWFFHISSDWAFYDNTEKSKVLIEIGTFIICFLLIAYSLFDLHKKPQISTAIINKFFLMPFLIIIGYEAVLHPSTFIIAGAIICAFIIYFFFNITKIKRINNGKRRAYYYNRLIRTTKKILYISVLLLTVLSILLSICIDVTYPYFRKKSALQDEQERYTSACSNLSSQKWKKLNDEEKVGVLQAIVDHEAKLAEMYTADIAIRDLNPSPSQDTYTSAQYFYEFNFIYIDEKVITNGNVTDVLNDVLHEYRHCQQYFITSSRKDIYNLQGFKENLEHYVSPDSFYGFDSYYNQLVEVDARTWAAEKVNEYIEYLSPEDFESSDLYQYYSFETDFRLETDKTDDNWCYTLYHNYKSGEDDSEDYISLKKYIGPRGTKRITIPSDYNGIPVRGIKTGAFEYVCDTVEELYISDNLAFTETSLYDCKNLTITVSDNNKHLTMIDGIMLVSEGRNLQWVDRKAIGTVTIPEYISFINPRSFENCKRVANIVVSRGNKDYFSYDGIVYDSETMWLYVCPAGKEGKVDIYDRCTEINNEGFLGCEKITEISIPPSVKRIYSQAFYGCNSIKKLVIPSSVEKIVYNAISGMSALEELTISHFTKTVAILDTTIVSLSITDCANLKDIYYDGSSSEAHRIEIINNNSAILHCGNKEYKYLNNQWVEVY